MARGKKASSRPAEWRIATFPDGKWRNADGMWRVADSADETIGIVNKAACEALLAYRHLLSVGKVALSVLKGLNPLTHEWAEIGHIMKSVDPVTLTMEKESDQIGQLTPEMLKTGSWRLAMEPKCEVDEKIDECLKDGTFKSLADAGHNSNPQE